MKSRRSALALLSCIGVLGLQTTAWAQNIDVMESHPSAQAVIGGVSSEFFVRFNTPVDHIRSRLVIKRGNDIVETLPPRLESAPDVLFARAPTLPPGDYILHWQVKSVSGQDTVQGDIPFTVGR